jgi:hypothetical protein
VVLEEARKQAREKLEQYVSTICIITGDGKGTIEVSCTSSFTGAELEAH